jgi:uncharacterized protein
MRWDNTDLVLQLKIQPKASRDEVVGAHGDQLKVRITAPPVDGKANAHLIAFLAAEFDVPKARVVLERGDTGRDKQIRVLNPARLPTWVG